MRKIDFGRPLISEAEKGAVLRVLDSPQLVHGPVAVQFEMDFSNFVGGGFSTSTSSATTALQLAYMVLGIGNDDEVIVTSLTHIATANSIRAVGATPVFVDVDLETGNISSEQVKLAISDKTKAICVVHYLGLPVDMTAIMEMARSNNLYVIEDCALALGSYYKGTHVGLIGDFGAFSFYPAKHITTGEGGMLVSKNENLLIEARKTKAFYYSKNIGERSVPGLYDIVGFGLNLRMSEIAAAIGVEQIKKLPTFLEIRSKNIELLTEPIGADFGRFISHMMPDGISGNYCASFVLNEKYSTKRDSIILKLKDLDIGTSIYYPVALPQSAYYKSNPRLSRRLDSSNAELLASSSIAFGVGPHLSAEDMVHVRNQFDSVLKGLE